MKAGIVVTALVSFALGFFVHALFFPYLFQDGDLVEAKKEVKGIINGKNQYADQNNDLITYVNYEKGRFRPSSVTVTRGNYLAITNRDTKNMMWLTSDEKRLSTVRGYAFGERLQVALSEPATYEIVNKLDQATLTVTIK